MSDLHNRGVHEDGLRLAGITRNYLKSALKLIDSMRKKARDDDNIRYLDNLSAKITDRLQL
jgi:hypothetical protein